MKAFLDGYLLDSQCFFFKVFANIESIWKKVSNVNPMTRLWANISSSTIFKLKLLEFIKLDEIACVQVLGPMEDEYCFQYYGVLKEQVMKLLDLPF
jgi:hypothetical protein